MGEARPTVLVVDDDPQVLETASAIVAALGYAVISARNGREALSIVRADGSIAVLFTDIRMPGMDGWELGRRSRETRPDLQLIYTSGHSNSPPPPGSAGYGPLLPKPWRSSQLAELIMQALTKGAAT
jgi:CheY-like chemotaxis protein